MLLHHRHLHLLLHHRLLLVAHRVWDELRFLWLLLLLLRVWVLSTKRVKILLLRRLSLVLLLLRLIRLLCLLHLVELKDVKLRLRLLWLGTA